MKEAAPKLSAGTAAIAAGWAALVMAAAFGVQGGLQSWKRQVEQLAQTQEQLRRTHGWLAVEGEVLERRKQVMGKYAEVSGSEAGWLSLNGFEQAAKQQGLTVSELKPFEVPGRKGEPARLRLDAKVEGNMEQVSGLLQRLPEEMPGVELESLQLMPREGGIQALFRLGIFVPPEIPGQQVAVAAEKPPAAEPATDEEARP